MLSYTIISRLNKISKIEIELLDNTFTNRWKDYLVRTLKRLPNLSWAATIHPMFNYGKIDTIGHFNKLKQSYELLQEHYGTGYSSEIAELAHLIENPKELKQSHLNLWHRHFTTNAVKFVTNMKSNHLILHTDTPDDVIFATIHAINQYTHDLEIITYPKIQRREKFRDKAYYGIRSATERNLDDSQSVWGDGNQEIPGEDFTFGQDYHYSVWMGDDIQGKDHFKCWYDEDDASNEDICGNTFMTPNVILDPYMINAVTMDNSEFKQFVLDSKKPINRYPIGNIVNIENIDWPVFYRGKLIRIELDGDILWKSE